MPLLLLLLLVLRLAEIRRIQEVGRAKEKEGEGEGVLLDRPGAPEMNENERAKRADMSLKVKRTWWWLSRRVVGYGF